MPRASSSKKAGKQTASQPEELPAAINPDSEPVYFWRPHEPYGFLGQWYPSVFTETQPDGSEITFQNAEQYMMYHKGLLFGPTSPATLAILKTDDPKTIKALGRKIPNFDDKVWTKHRLEIVTKGNILKFQQNPELKAQLLETGKRPLVEASPLDKIWGIGFRKSEAERKRGHWGLNLLGIALEKAREEIVRVDSEKLSEVEDEKVAGSEAS